MGPDTTIIYTFIELLGLKHSTFTRSGGFFHFRVWMATVSTAFSTGRATKPKRHVYAPERHVYVPERQVYVPTKHVYVPEKHAYVPEKRV